MPIYEYEGKAPRIHASAYIHPTASIIGNVTIEACCYIGPCASIRGDFGAIHVGEGSNIQDNSTLHVGHGERCVLGPDSHVGHGAIVHGATLVRNSLIGMNAVVMDGTVVGDSSIVAACAFVKTRWDVPARSLVAGVPARVIRPLTNAELQSKAEATRKYQELAKSCRQTLREISLDQQEYYRSGAPRRV
jgi:phenylacetic acid degradation protein/carnitine operon protein CaiE